MDGKAVWTGLRKFVSLTLWTYLTIVVVRVFESLFMAYYSGCMGNHLMNNLLGLCFDIFYFTLASVILYLPFCLFSKISEDKTLLAYRIVYAIVSLFAMLLVGYFSQALVPLDRVFLMYSFGEILNIVSSSQTTAWWMYLCIAFVPFFLFVTSRRVLEIKGKISLTLIVMALVTCAVVRLVCYNPTVNNSGYFEQCNKICYFFKSFHKSARLDRDDTLSTAEIKSFQSYFPEHEFVSNTYPFLYKNSPDDVIGSYFNFGEKLPNIVLVVVEGLGRENSGKYSRFISTTPFLDSLAEHSLYWLNCLSVSQRTVGVFPALFGALPFGREGFMAYKRNAPNFNSLPKILVNNGYFFSFFYGGKKDFDNMDEFFYLNGENHGFNGQSVETNERGEWGLYDKCLFSEAMKTLDFESDKPRFDVYLTLTSHTPWDYPDQEKYISAYKEMKSFDNKEHYYLVQPTASFLYVDEAIRQLITDYSHRPGFENTIFIITGDHNYYLYTFLIEKYHVPLLIWSPMLKKNAYFPAMVSHRDVAPTILNMLSKTYGIHTPDEVAWLNGSLDTSLVFRSKTFAPQMDASRNIVNMLYGDYLVDNEDLYKIEYLNSTLKLSPATDSDDKIMNFFKLYKLMDKYVCDNDLLVKSEENTHYDWISLDGLEDISMDTIVVNKRIYPLTLIEVGLKEKYKAVKVKFDMAFHFNEEDISEGISIGVCFVITDKKGNVVYNNYNEIRSFDELVKEYQFSEVLKQSMYQYSDGYTLKIYLANWGRKYMKIVNVKGTIRVAL